MNTNTQSRNHILSELKKIHESGPIIGEDEARREFFIQQELSKTPERGFGRFFYFHTRRWFQRRILNLK